MDTKQCSRCCVEKPLREFHRNRNEKDGHFTICKKCRATARGRIYIPPPPDGFKRCSRCGEVKPISEFNRRGKSKDGYHFRCKKCVTEKRGCIYKVPEKLPEGYKRCTKCKQLFPSTSEFFYPHKSGLNGLRPDCKACFLEACLEYQRNNKDQVNEKNRLWRENHPDQARAIGRKHSRKWRENNHERAIKRTQDWRKANPEKVKAYDKEYSETHRAERRQTRREYRLNNREKIRQHQRVGKQRRRTRLRNLPNTFTTREWRQALEYWSHKCAICGRTEGEDFTLAPDHWIALSDKRADNPGTVAPNIIPLCHGIGGCNNEKHDNDAVEFLKDKLGETAAMQKLAEIEAYFEYVKKLKNEE